MESLYRPNVEGLYGHGIGLTGFSCYGLKNVMFLNFEAKARVIRDLSRFCGRKEFRHTRYIIRVVLEKVLMSCGHNFGFWPI